MNILRFLREHAKDYDCSSCGTNHSESSLRVLGRLESAWIVRVTCSKCQTSFKLLVVVEGAADEGGVRASAVPVKEDHPSTLRRRSPVTLDEVLDAHEFLRAYDGGLDPFVVKRVARAGALPRTGATPPGSTDRQA